MPLPSSVRAYYENLSEKELTDRLEEAWRTYEEAAAETKTRRWYHLHWFRPWRWSPATRPYSIPWLGNYWPPDSAVDKHLSLVEIRNLTDEIERRVASRKEANS